MLNHLSVKNYALIDRLELPLENGFSVITGETGAGKSIILGALSLVLGKRADLKSLRDSSKKCVVEANFHLNEQQHSSFFSENELDFELPTIVRREISPSGKSRAFINDTPVNLTVLSELSERVIDVHSQHQNLLLSDNQFQLELLDSFADNDGEKQGYIAAYRHKKEVESELKKFISYIENEDIDSDYLNFLLNELIEAKLDTGEQESIEAELLLLENSEKIHDHLNLATLTIEDNGNQGVRRGLLDIFQALRNLEPLHTDYQELANRINSVRIEIDDIHQEIEKKALSIEFSPEKLEKLQSRLNQLIHLQKKHAVNSVEELIAKREDIARKVENLANVEEKLALLKKNLEDAVAKLSLKAEKLHKTRKSIAPVIEARITKILQELNMADASFSINIEAVEQYTLSGADDIQFYFSANKGVKPQPLSKIASGGEMSRVMLALKATMAANNKLPSIIFDEIDTGVSGETAGKIGGILKQMGKEMQVIAITHLPQIASMGQFHYKVLKTSDAQTTITDITQLNKDERLQELARLLSGEQITEAALANARHLLQFA